MSRQPELRTAQRATLPTLVGPVACGTCLLLMIVVCSPAHARHATTNVGLEGCPNSEGQPKTRKPRV